MRHVTSLRPNLWRLLLILILVQPLLIACDSEMGDLVADMAFDWAEEKNLVSFNEQGNIQPNLGRIAIYEAQRADNAIFGEGYTTGDTQLDAALDAGKVARNVRNADNAAAEGMENQDPAKIQEAIDIRPNDWAYHEQQASVYLATDNPGAASDAFENSERLVDERIAGGGDCRYLTSNMLRSRLAAIDTQMEKEPDNLALQTARAQAEDRLNALQFNHEDHECQ